MTGIVCLQGGAEFSSGYRPVDAELLRRSRGPVVVAGLAGAVGREYQMATTNGVRHYAALAADREDVQVLAAPDMREDPAAGFAALRRARMLVLPGGSPSRLLRVLTDTPLGGLVAELLGSGGTVVGSSAGAMVLGDWTVLPDRPGGPVVAPGLGVVPGVLVVPHWTGGREDWLRAVRGGTPAGTVVLGIPEECGVLVQDGAMTVLGSAVVRVLPVGQDRSPGHTWPAPSRSAA